MVELFIKILFTTISIFGIVVLGGYLRHKKIVTHEAKVSLLKLLINVFLPCLIFHKVGLEANKENLLVTLSPLLWGFCIIILGISITYTLAHFFPKLLGVENYAQHRTFSLSTGIQNYGFLALPIVTTLFPNQGIESALLIHNVGVELAIWTLGIIILSGSRENLAWKNLLNAPAIAIIVSLGYQQTISSYTNESIWVAVKLLGDMAIPVGLLSAGFTIAEKWEGHKFFSISSIKKSVSGVSLRLILIPSLMFLSIILIDPSITIKKVILIQLAMPSALAPIYLSDYYNADSPTAFQIAISTTIVGFFTIGFWLIFGVNYFGLK